MSTSKLACVQWTWFTLLVLSCRDKMARTFITGIYPFLLRNLNPSIYYVAYILLAHVWGKLSEFFFSMNRGSIIHRKYFYGSASLLPLTTAFSVSIKLWHIIFIGIYSGSTNCGVDRVYSLCYFFNLKKAIFSEFLHFFLLLGLTFT